MLVVTTTRKKNAPQEGKASLGRRELADGTEKDTPVGKLAHARQTPAATATLRKKAQADDNSDSNVASALDAH